jgi:hypothetical protein
LTSRAADRGFAASSHTPQKDFLTVDQGIAIFELDERRTELTLQNRVEAAPDVISTELDGETVLMHVSNGMYFGLNAVGSVIWDTMKFPVTVESLCTAVTEEFDVERNACENDVLDLLAQFEEHGLVRLVDATE